MKRFKVGVRAIEPFLKDLEKAIATHGSDVRENPDLEAFAAEFFLFTRNEMYKVMDYIEPGYGSNRPLDEMIDCLEKG